MLGPEIVQQTSEQIQMIRDTMKASQDRQKSDYDKRTKPLEFQIGDRVFLKVSPSKGIGRALKNPTHEMPNDDVEIRENLTTIAEPTSISRKHFPPHFSSVASTTQPVPAVSGDCSGETEAATAISDHFQQRRAATTVQGSPLTTSATVPAGFQTRFEVMLWPFYNIVMICLNYALTEL
ncbi:hypothetical protein RJT34_20235 [Clitoria ternatea]|uniref:Reverse transcriptase domain-containing protein n=1 Tax=Clitoria ternatea TaxID=43366 RepID=A0AAN9ISH5_CLITE